jgi:hypothetical protein
MDDYGDELSEAQRRGRLAYEAMDAWVSRPLDSPGAPGETLEGHARVLRDSRERLRRLRELHGERDDIDAALAQNEDYHRALGLSLRD